MDAPLLALDGLVCVGADGAELRIARGEMAALLGPPASGKTALLRVLACLDRPAAGRYALDGVDVGACTDDALARLRNRRVGSLFGSPRLIDRLSAQLNVETSLEYGGGHRYKVRARDALALVGLGAPLRMRPPALSPLDRHRVAIARAIVMNPALLVADEPLEGLHERDALEVLALLQRLNTRRGLTIVLATPDASVADYCTRVVAFADGRVAGERAVRDRRVAAADLRRLEEAAA